MSLISHVGVKKDCQMIKDYISDQYEMHPFDSCASSTSDKTNCDVDVLFVSMDQDESNAIDKLYRLQESLQKERLQVVFLTESIDEYLQVEAYKNGVDEIIELPIGKRLFQYKLESIKKRISCCEKTLMNCGIGELKFNKEKFAVVWANGEVALSKREFEILSLLDSNRKKVFTRDEIKTEVWGNENIHLRTIDVYIKKLRSVLGDSRIKTINGIGYKLSN